MDLIGATYKHYKGGLYILLDEAINESNKDKMIIYRSLQTGKLWVREKREFFGYKHFDGEKVRRFTRVQL